MLLRHTPCFIFFHWSALGSLFQIVLAHDFVSESYKCHTLYWHGHIITNHIFGCAIYYTDILMINLVFDKKISDVNMFRPFTRGQLTVLSQQNCTLIILIQSRCLCLISHTIQDFFCPQYLTHYIVRYNDPGFNWAFCVYFLLAWDVCDASSS